MNILITGANGQLGRCIKDRVDEIVVENKGTDNVYFYTDIIENESDGIARLDITDKEAVKTFVKDNYINVIVNCAAYTNVDKAEDDYDTAEKINTFAPKYLAEAALSVGAKLIHISTDYVFNGTGFMPYTEDRLTLPASVYGSTKRTGEEFIQQSGCKYLIFRTAWLYSEYGNNFVKTMLRLFEEKDEINVVNDQIGTPTYAGNLAELIVNIIERTTPLEGKDVIPLLENGIYHFTDEGVASWYDFAWQIYEYYVELNMILNGANSKHTKINGVTTKQYGSKVKRPYYSVLDKTKYKTDFKELHEPMYWKETLKDVMFKLVDKNNR